MEKQFEDAWSFVTKELREKARSLGSRLHLGNERLFYSYAQWQSREVRPNAKLGGSTYGRCIDTRSPA